MAEQIYANNATTTIRGSLSTSATTIVVNDSTGFPSPTGGDWFVATLDGGGNYFEVVKVTAVSGTTWTVQRAQEGTVAKLWQPNSRIECRVTKGILESLRDGGLVVNVKSFGAKGDGVTDDTAAIQAALDANLSVYFPPSSVGYKLTVPVNLRSGHRITGHKALVFRADQFDHLFSIVDKSDIIIQGMSFSHSYNMVGDRSNKSAIYGLRSSKVKVTNCDFNDIGLFAVSSDVSGDDWIVTDNRFFDIAGTAYDARGGFNHLVTNNLIVNTGDDAIDVANTPGAFSKRTIVANNIMIRPGQVHTGGGGIRVNSFGSTVADNQFYDANMYFVVVAALSTDGSMKPDKTIITGNVGYGIKPTTNNTTGCILVKNSATTQIYGNTFDPRGDKNITITNVTNNGSGQCRFTATNHGYTTGNVVRVEGVVGVSGANGSGAVTVINSSTFDIATLTFSGAYVSGGVAFNAIVGIRAYSGDNAPTKNDEIIVHNNVFSNVEDLLRVQNLGLNRATIDNNLVINYQNVTQMQDTSTMAELNIKRNDLRNGNISLFLGSNTVSITNLMLHDNVCTPLSSSTIPIQFTSATITKAEILRNKLGCGSTQFNAATNVAEMFFDGDYSGRRYNQGTGTILTGQTAGAAISHGCTLGTGAALQPKTGELTMNVSLGATVAALVQPTEIFATTFTPRTTPAAPADIGFTWRLAPVTQRYVNGVLV